MSLPRLQLDYHAPSRPRRGLGAAVLLAAVLTAFLLVERYRDLRGEIAALDEARALLPAERRTPPRKGLAEELKSAEAVVQQLALPWSDMVRAVEAAGSPEVAVLHLEPLGRERRLRLGAEAKSEEAMLAYVRALAGSPALAEVHLAAHQVVLEDPQRPLQFTVAARLRGSP